MRYFYEMYPDATNRQQPADDLGIEGDFLYSKGHHMALLDKMKGNPEKAMVYDRKTLEKRVGL